MDYKSLQDLYEHGLKALYGAEKEIYRRIPEVIHDVTEPELLDLLARRLEDSRVHGEWIERIFLRHGFQTQGAASKGMEGILDEFRDWLEVEAEPAVKDAAVIEVMQRAAHYKIASYGSLYTYAGLLDFKDDEDLIHLALYEARAEDRQLAGLSEKIHPEALGFEHA